MITRSPKSLKLNGLFLRIKKFIFILFLMFTDEKRLNSVGIEFVRRV